jgi:hypothetical protein
LPDAASCLRRPGAVRKRSQADRLGAGGARAAAGDLDAAHRRSTKRDRPEDRNRTSALPRKQEPVLAGFRLTPTAPLDDLRASAADPGGVLHL